MTRGPAGLVLASLVGLAGPTLACSDGGPETVVTVDGVEIPTDRFDALHTDVGSLDDLDRAGGVVLLILREAFVSQAEDQLGLSLDQSDVDAAYQEALLPLQERGEPSEVLAQRNETEDRLLVNTELDLISEAVGADLVRTEGPGFDLAAAEERYLLDNAEVCLRHIQLADGDDGQAVLARLADGEDFEAVAREVSIDPFVSQESGIGAGGDLGCAAPAALPIGLDTAVLDLPLDEITGPVASAMGGHIVEVTGRTEPDLVAEHDQVLEAAVPVQGPELFRLWAVEVLGQIDVEVDPSFGRWAVLPETDPVPTVVPPNRYDDIIEP